MNKRERVMTSALLTISLAAAFVTNSQADAVQPGSAEDPLVTKSYVDGKINQQAGTSGVTASGTVNNQEIVSDVLAQIEFLYGNELRAQPGAAQSSTTYEPVSALAGQVIIGHEGTEIILRSGAAIGYCPGENGLVNATEGGDVGNAASIPANNLLIVPRYDGRGVQVVNDAWFIIRGGYDVLD